MIKRASAPDELSSRELASLVKAVLSSSDEDDVVRRLRGEEAQTFIDVVDKACSPLVLHREIRFTGDVLYRLGAGKSRLFITDPKERSQIFIQDMRPQRTDSGIAQDTSLLRPNGQRAVQWCFWGRMEGEIFWQRCRSKGYKSILAEGLTEDNWRGLLFIPSFTCECTDRVLCRNSARRL